MLFRSPSPARRYAAPGFRPFLSLFSLLSASPGSAAARSIVCHRFARTMRLSRLSVPRGATGLRHRHPRSHNTSIRHESRQGKQNLSSISCIFRPNLHAAMPPFAPGPASPATPYIEPVPAGSSVSDVTARACRAPGPPAAGQAGRHARAAFSPGSRDGQPGQSTRRDFP